MSKFFDKLNKTQRKFEELRQKSLDPIIIKDRRKYKELMKEYKNLEPIIETYDEYKKHKEDYEEAKELLSDKNIENDFKEMVLSQYEKSKESIKELEEKLKILLMPKDPNDDKNVIVEIRGGAGGDEAALFAGDLFRMYSMYAEKKNFKIDVLSLNETEMGGFKEITFEIIGDGAYSRFKFEKGVHRVQRVPKTETQGRVHTSTVTVAVLPEVEETEVSIDPKDIEITTFKASGAGGQKVNKTETAIRAVYLPTGLVVECQDERSQYQNKFKALKILRSRLYEQAQIEAEEKLANERKEQVGTGDRSERIRTYNFPQGRLSDHRINLTLYNLDQIMNGNLDELIDKLITENQIKALSESNDSN